MKDKTATGHAGTHREPALPQWDAADPHGSFSRYAESLHQKAKWMFLKDKMHAEMMFLFRPAGEGLLLLVQGNRDAFVEKLKELIRSSDIIGIVHISEAWFRFGGDKDHIIRQIMSGEMTVSDLQPEHKKEALVTTIQSRGGLSFCWMDPIVRDAKTGEVSLRDGFKLDNVEGRFGRLFG